jgi:tRNA(fMet)-specific endonuclease VapC
VKGLLDTNICIYIIKRNPIEVRRRFRGYATGELGVSSVTVAELYFGAFRSQHGSQDLAALEDFILSLVVLPFDEEAATEYGRLRTDLVQKGTPLGPIDMFIAAHSLHLDVPLITNNVREFSMVPGLRIENWVTAQR